jgi:hypothetical protein
MTLVAGTTEADLLPPGLKGNPYFLDPQFNPLYPEYLPVGGIQPDPAALMEIAAYYQTSAALSRPLVLMHTTGDPIVPEWHAWMYLQKAVQQGTLLKQVTYIPVNRYGHCNFTPAEMVIGFYTMVLRATFTPFTAAQIKEALPQAAWQAEFKQLKEKHVKE